MKKLIIALMLVSSVAMGQILGDYMWNINWGIAGAQSPDGGDPLQAYDITWTLLNASAGDTVLYTMTSSAGASSIGFTDERGKTLEFGQYLIPVTSLLYGSTDISVEQELYQRIELSGASGNYIWEGQLSAVTPKLYEDSGIPPTSTDLNDVGTFIYTTDWQQAQTVPEPATMSLLGLGALAMALRRKLRK